MTAVINELMKGIEHPISKQKSLINFDKTFKLVGPERLEIPKINFGPLSDKKLQEAPACTRAYFLPDELTFSVVRPFPESANKKIPHKERFFYWWWNIDELLTEIISYYEEFHTQLDEFL